VLQTYFDSQKANNLIGLVSIFLFQAIEALIKLFDSVCAKGTFLANASWHHEANYSYWSPVDNILCDLLVLK
jgi:hypothetical protein